MRFAARILLLSSILSPALAMAGEHTHKIKGTIRAIEASTIELNVGQGKTASIAIDEQTQFLQGKARIEPSVVGVGDKVTVISVMDDSGANIAREVRVEPARSPERSSPPSSHSGHFGHH